MGAVRYSPEKDKEKAQPTPPCVVTPAKCRRPRGTLSCADRASGGEAHSHLSCVRVGSVPSLGGGQKGKNLYFLLLIRDHVEQAEGGPFLNSGRPLARTTSGACTACTTLLTFTTSSVGGRQRRLKEA